MHAVNANYFGGQDLNTEIINCSKQIGNVLTSYDLRGEEKKLTRLHFAIPKVTTPEETEHIHKEMTAMQGYAKKLFRLLPTFRTLAKEGVRLYAATNETSMKLENLLQRLGTTIDDIEQLNDYLDEDIAFLQKEITFNHESRLARSSSLAEPPISNHFNATGWK